MKSPAPWNEASELPLLTESDYAFSRVEPYSSLNRDREVTWKNKYEHNDEVLSGSHSGVTNM
jgi:hypothetical protein